MLSLQQCRLRVLKTPSARFSILGKETGQQRSRTSVSASSLDSKWRWREKSSRLNSLHTSLAQHWGRDPTWEIMESTMPPLTADTNDWIVQLLLLTMVPSLIRGHILAWRKEGQLHWATRSFTHLPQLQSLFMDLFFFFLFFFHSDESFLRTS